MGTDRSRPDQTRPVAPGLRLRSPTAVSPGRLERALWLAVAVALVADVATTYYGLERGLVEGNPVARAALGSLGYAGLGLLKLLALGVAAGCRTALPCRYGAVVPGALAGTWGLAAGANLLLLLSVA